jgi:hypothetical protein
MLPGFKGDSALSYPLTALRAIVFTPQGCYRCVVIGLGIMAISTTMLISVVQQPANLVAKLEEHAEFAFTFKGRFIVDFFLALFLFGMGAFGVAMGVIHLVLIIGIRLLATTFAGAFEEIFRSEGESKQGGFDSPYGSDPSGGGFPPQPSADL